MKTLLLLALSACCLRAEFPDLSTVRPDLVLPPVKEGPPGPGKRVKQTTPGWEGTELYHLIYLPKDWTPGVKYPVLVEYAGNGEFKGKYGDVSDGSVEGCRLGYGISGGKGFIWVSMPFVEVKEGRKYNAIKWWGDIEETKRYCQATVKHVCGSFGGDPGAVVLCGFSRGSIACNFIGLHDNRIAKLWRAFICYSHYDGTYEGRPYKGADRDSSLARLKRLRGRPQWICHEESVDSIRRWIEGTGIPGNYTYEVLPFRNHNNSWVLRDIPARRHLRSWLGQVLYPAPAAGRP